jgi:hypothetical protein
VERDDLDAVALRGRRLERHVEHHAREALVVTEACRDPSTAGGEGGQPMTDRDTTLRGGCVRDERRVGQARAARDVERRARVGLLQRQRVGLARSP